MTWPAPINVGGNCTWYCFLPLVPPFGSASPLSVQSNGSGEWSVPYSAFVPNGETRPIYITHASITVQGAQTFMQGVSTLVIETPAESGVWKILGTALDGVNGGICDRAFAPGVPLSPGDDLCLQTAWSAQVAGASVWGGSSPSYHRQSAVDIKYTIGA